MYGFSVKADCRLKYPRCTRFYRAPADLKSVPGDQIFIDCGEGSEVNRYLGEQKQKPGESSGNGGTQAKKAQYVNYLDEQRLRSWPHIPPRFGRISAGLLGAGFHRHEEPAPLAQQCRALKEKKPGKRHFRFAVFNALGTNMGDCLFGMTALRVVVREMRKHLDSVLFEMYVAPRVSPLNSDILGHEEWAGPVHFLGPTLEELGAFDGYFDFTALLNLPRFGELPAVDWYLWWFGLDPDRVAAADKRNRLPLSWPAWQAVAAELRRYPAPRRVLFNHAASVPLRSCPEKEAVRLLRELLAADRESHFYLSSSLPLQDGRVHDLSAMLKAGSDRFIALTAQMDAVISVDTFSIHLADAFSLPVLGLYTSVPPEIYPYYPTHRGLQVPGTEKLAGYRKSKLPDKEWKGLEKEYRKAWKRLTGARLARELATLLAAQSAAGSAPSAAAASRRLAKPVFYSEPHRHAVFRRERDARVPIYDNRVAAYGKGCEIIAHSAAALAPPGGCLAVVAPGSAAPLLPLARRLGPDGELQVFEPRRLRRELLAADLREQCPEVAITVHAGLPLKSAEIRLPREEPLSETYPHLWGNSLTRERVPQIDLAELGLERMTLLLLLAPSPMAAVLEAAAPILQVARATVVCSPLPDKAALGQLARILKPLSYRCWVSYLEGRPEGPYYLLGLPQESPIQVKSMVPVTM